MKRFKRFLALIGVAIIFSSILATTVSAAPGELGFFGGITEGVRLPKTTELIIAATNGTTAAANNIVNMPYEELIFLNGGEPVKFEGLLNVRYNGTVSDKTDAGTYRVTYTVGPSATTGDIKIARNIVFSVNWRRSGSQMIYDYKAVTWTETVTAGEGDFVVDASQSHFDISILADQTPGVVYYKGNTSQKAVYKNGDAATTLDVTDSFYGYESPWSKAEVHRQDALVLNPEWQMEYQLRPSVSVMKTLSYSPNEPTAISFSGNYREVCANTSGLSYNIYTMPTQFYGTRTEGNINMRTYNTFEQLTAPDVSYLKGHFAEDDIRKLFSMQILEGDTAHYQPAQAITRGQLTTMLVKAVKLPVDFAEQANGTSNKRGSTINIVFPDVFPQRADYPYIMAAYRGGLAEGRGAGGFAPDASITREEAVVMLLRTIGLSNLGLNPTPITPFVDDARISSWAKRDISAAARIGLIYGDENGRLNPKAVVSKAEAAALVNRLINYMRDGLSRDYTSYIVNFAN